MNGRCTTGENDRKRDPLSKNNHNLTTKKNAFFFCARFDHKNSLPFVMEIQRSDSIKIAVTVGQNTLTQNKMQNDNFFFYFYWLTYIHIWQTIASPFLIPSHKRAHRRQNSFSNIVVFFLLSYNKNANQSEREWQREIHIHTNSGGLVFERETCLHSFRLSSFRTHHMWTAAAIFAMTH